MFAGAYRFTWTPNKSCHTKYGPNTRLLRRRINVYVDILHKHINASPHIYIYIHILIYTYGRIVSFVQLRTTREENKPEERQTEHTKTNEVASELTCANPNEITRNQIHFSLSANSGQSSTKPSLGQQFAGFAKRFKWYDFLSFLAFFKDDLLEHLL